MSKPKETLFLILNAKWFEMIRQGTKKEEYRKCGKHWEAQIWRHRDTLKRVIFQLGYNKNYRIEFEIECISHYTPNKFEKMKLNRSNIWKSSLVPVWGFDIDVSQYVIRLGKRLS